MMPFRIKFSMLKFVNSPETVTVLLPNCNTFVIDFSRKYGILVLMIVILVFKNNRSDEI